MQGPSFSYLFDRTPLHLLLIATCLLLVTPSFGATISGQVFSVSQGDRLTLFVDPGKYRDVQLVGIEAPAPDLMAGRIAKRYLHNFLAGKFVTIEYHALTSKAVILGTVLHGGADMNLRMLEVGLARVKPDQNLAVETLQRYRQAQQRAQKMGLGIWK